MLPGIPRLTVVSGLCPGTTARMVRASSPPDSDSPSPRGVGGLPFDGGHKRFGHGVKRRLSGRRKVRGRFDSAVRLNLDAAGGKVEFEDGGGRQHRDRVKRRPVTEILAKGEELAEAVGRHRATQARDREQRLDLGGEDQCAIHLGPIERPHAKPVADERHSLLLLVAHRSGKASVERGQKPRALHGEAVHQQLEYRVAIEAGAVTDQVSVRFSGGVELSVEGERHAILLGECDCGR